MKQKAARNKTIDFSLEEGHEYLERCILAENGDQLKTALQDGSTMTPDALYDQYIIGDTFQVMKELPPNFVDLLIVDPPYNLAKDYHGNKFNAVGREEYREYTIKWVREVLPLLKKTAPMLNGAFGASTFNPMLAISSSVNGTGLDPGPTNPVTPRVLRTTYHVSSFIIILIKTYAGNIFC